MNNGNYKLYMIYRSQGYTSMQSYEKVKSMDSESIAQEFLAIVKKAVALLSIIIYNKIPKEYRDSYLSIVKVWVSPPKSPPVQLPLYMAIRIVKKKGWLLAGAHPKRTISKREAFGILLHGDKA